MAGLARALAHAPRNRTVARLARSRAAAWLVNPHADVTAAELRAAVAGKTVLVTGASYGLGAATARRLGAAGATVVLLARTEHALEETARAVREAGGFAHPYPVDLSDPAAVEPVAADIIDRHGPVDVLVNNAGKSIRRSIADSTGRFGDFERTIGVNYLGPVRLMLALLPAMRERGSGHLVNISTIGVRIPPGPRWAAYQASKSAFDVFFRSTAAEAAADGVTASSVYMALIRTRMSAPTAIFDNLPGLSADEAAGIVCRAIVSRPAKISPWWADAAEVVFSAARHPWERIVAGMYRDSHGATTTQDTREIRP
ncbi:SDR family NAD(P)-dependent oxidoreductase [Haloechinothrix sp. LS1_15]|uniref:SDR family NAD(P)-dependent oxidoreductase n=1 Tax=Haloechinothrix sp. LS1_15 TaxID=2652248 RepID=UPI002947BB71|nr:SDR family NAD(P)-dependent oxidoreductase [Haloechinothrix sp. LS1_15]MDV6014660.1 SDR family NAD(P)-dependent oxidoreductase [Haloechinothrix sp. LS1_15]